MVDAVFAGFGPDDASGRSDDGAIFVETELERDLFGGCHLHVRVDVESSSTDVPNDALDLLASRGDLDRAIDLGAGQAAGRIEVGKSPYGGNQFIALKGLEQNIIGSGANGFRVVFRSVGPRQQNDPWVAPVRMRLKAVAELLDRDVGQMHIRNHDRRRMFVRALERRGSGVGEVHGAASRQKNLSEFPEHGHVVYE